MDEAAVERVLAEQRRYYRERAPEYEDWWFRRGAYALDRETEARRFADVREVEPRSRRSGRVATSSSLPPGPGSGPSSLSGLRIM